MMGWCVPVFGFGCAQNEDIEPGVSGCVCVVVLGLGAGRGAGLGVFWSAFGPCKGLVVVGGSVQLSAGAAP